MEKIDRIAVIGCTAAGRAAAMTTKTFAPEAKLPVIREEENFLTRCAMPCDGGC